MHRSSLAYAYASGRQRMPTAAPRRGFTLIEMIIVMVLTGLVSAVVARFIVGPVQAYLDTRARAQRVDEADLALRRVARDLRTALPNSTRVTGSNRTLEFIPTTGGARYATQGSGALQFGTLDTSFDIVGPGLAVTAGQSVVFYNLGPGIVGNDAYAASGTAAEQASSNRRALTNATGTATTLTLSSAAALPTSAMAAPYRAQLVNSPITYRCDLTAGQLVRYQGYGFIASQADPPTGGSSAVLATGVSACRFDVEGSLVAAQAALVHLQLTLTSAGASGAESITLHHAVHVDNMP